MENRTIRILSNEYYCVECDSIAEGFLRSKKTNYAFELNGA